MKGGNYTVFFPGLNGLRAIAALAVVCSHITVGLDRFNLNNHLLGTLPNGNPKGIDLSDFGVSIFFALSGFLITYLLLEEGRRSEINVRNFYIRRILRIWPLYYAFFLLAVLAINYWHEPHDTRFNFFYIFFTANVPKVFQSKSELLGHYWSLGVEEQFYLFWPLLVKKSKGKLLQVTMILFVLLVGLKGIAHFGFPGSLFETAIYVNRFDCMLIGAMGATLLFQGHVLFIRLSSNKLVQVFAWAAIFLSAANRFHIATFLDHEIMSGVTVLLIIGQCRSTGLLNLNSTPFDFLGKISYGIYVIHPLVIYLLPMAVDALRPPVLWLNYILAYAGVLGLTIITAHLSYEYLEKPFLRLKGRFSTIKSRNSKEALNSDGTGQVA